MRLGLGASRRSMQILAYLIQPFVKVEAVADSSKHVFISCGEYGV
jgi:hypothetical protein